MGGGRKDLRCHYKCRWCKTEYPSNVDLGACPECLNRGIMNPRYGIGGGGLNPRIAIIALLERIEKLEEKS